MNSQLLSYLDRGDPIELPYYSTSRRALGSSAMPSSHWYLSSNSGPEAADTSTCLLRYQAAVTVSNIAWPVEPFIKARACNGSRGAEEHQLAGKSGSM